MGVREIRSEQDEGDGGQETIMSRAPLFHGAITGHTLRLVRRLSNELNIAALVD